MINIRLFQNLSINQDYCWFWRDKVGFSRLFIPKIISGLYQLVET
eukprot:UN08727